MSRISVSPSMSWSRTSTIAGRFSAQMSSQMPGRPLATRVMSRKPPAASRSSAACSSARSLAQAHQGRCRQVRHVRHDGHELIVAFRRQCDHLGTERRHDRGDLGEHGVVDCAGPG